ncbi:MAG TPA: hypothetical protein VHO06_16595 [Polyangia bacterium]|nr:hypothetical protein [Polyangia bacterium]
MSLSRPTANKILLTCACIAGAFAMLLGVSAAPALAYSNPPAAKSSTPPSTTSPSTKTSTGCPAASVSQPFRSLGDEASYFPVPGGTFEEGTAGWSLTNATIGTGNESYNVVGGTHSLAIAPNGIAVSPAFCVSKEDPSLRLFARQTSGSWAVLNVILRWQESSGATHETTVGSLQSGTAWKLSPVLALASSLPMWQPGESVTVQVVLKPEQYGGAWAVDDVFADPRMR